MVKQMKNGRRHSSWDEKQKYVRNLMNVTVAIILVASSIAYTFFMFNRTNSQYNIRLQETGDELAKEIYSQVNSSINYVEGVAECFSNYEDIHCDEAVETLVRVGKTSHFTRMWLTKTDGSAISSELKQSDGSGRDYLERAKKGESGISNVQVSRVNGEKNVVVFAPVYYNGQVTGMVIGILRLDNLLQIMDVQCFNGEGRCAIYTDDGDIIAQSDDWGKKDYRQSKYDYITQIGIRDWNIVVSFPESVITGEMKTNIIITIVMCLIWAAVLGTILVNIFRERNMEFKRKAEQDSLTLLMNRGTIEEAVEQRLQSDREGISAFVIFDVDKFKTVNDSVGHSLGDFLLKEIARLMKESFEEGDSLGRLGGDEFAVLITDAADRHALLEKLELFRQKVNKISIKGMKNSTVSIGIVFACEEVNDFNSFYQKADKAMYESKKQGGNRITVYDEMKE